MAGATIIARDAADTKIERPIAGLADDATDRKIRAGTFGDGAVLLEVPDLVKSSL